MILRCRAVAGREYHYHSNCHRHAGCSPALTAGVLARPDYIRSLGNPISAVHSSPTIRYHRVPYCGGSCFRTSSELMYLTNGYSVVKEHRRATCPHTPHCLLKSHLLRKFSEKILKPAQNRGNTPRDSRAMNILFSRYIRHAPAPNIKLR